MQSTPQDKAFHTQYHPSRLPTSNSHYEHYNSPHGNTYKLGHDTFDYSRYCVRSRRIRHTVSHAIRLECNVHFSDTASSTHSRPTDPSPSRWCTEHPTNHFPNSWQGSPHLVCSWRGPTLPCSCSRVVRRNSWHRWPKFVTIAWQHSPVHRCTCVDGHYAS